jgi:hypothetical protein
LLHKNLEEKKEVIEDHATIAANVYEDWLSDGHSGKQDSHCLILDEPPLIIKMTQLEISSEIKES